jgi:hypothetical protein
MVIGKGREGSVSGYFRSVFADRPEWLHEKSNDAILARYRTDHGIAPAGKVDPKIKANLANLKSVLRRQARKKAKRGPGRPPRDAAAAAHAGAAVGIAPVVRRTSTNRLEMLEETIDDCLTLAKHTDREGLHDVIQMLRRARNAVVWKLGQ